MRVRPAGTPVLVSLLLVAVGLASGGCGEVDGNSQRDSVAVTAPTKDVPLAPLASDSIPPKPPETAIRLLERVSRESLADPAHWAQGWYDAERNRVVISIKRGSPASVWREARALAGTSNTVVAVDRSFSDLKAIMDQVTTQKEIAGVRVNDVSINWRHNRITLGADRVTDDLRAELAAEFGDTVAVTTVARAHLDIGDPSRR